MVVRDEEWPGYTQWYCCPRCRRLWTHQGREMVVLERQFTLGPARATPGIPGRCCLVCAGDEAEGVISL